MFFCGIFLWQRLKGTRSVCFCYAKIPEVKTAALKSSVFARQKATRIQKEDFLDFLKFFCYPVYMKIFFKLNVFFFLFLLFSCSSVPKAKNGDFKKDFSEDETSNLKNFGAMFFIKEKIHTLQIFLLPTSAILQKQFRHLARCRRPLLRKNIFLTVRQKFIS